MSREKRIQTMSKKQIISLPKPKAKKKAKTVTIMLLSHSQKKPFQFRLPAWGLKAMFLIVVLFAGVTGFSYLSAMNLNTALNQKQKLEAQLQQLSNEKKQMAEYNQKLEYDNAAQEEKLGKLKEISDQNRQELDELHKREREILNQLNMESAQVSSETASPDENGPTLIPLTQVKLYSPANSDPDIVKQSLLSNRQQIAALYKDYDSISAKIQEKRSAHTQKKAVRRQVVDYALQFVGGRYVYGGNDPHSGVDCSGFTRYVLNHAAGVSLNRTAAGQSSQGENVGLKNIRPGDLVFYTKGGSVSHVAMYIGEGQVVHASTEKTGIIVTPVNYRQVYKVENVLGG